MSDPTGAAQPGRSTIVVGGIPVEIVRKAIKHIHLGVYPPEGRVRVAAPLRVDDERVRLLVVDKLAWIRRRQARFAAQPRQSPRMLVSGESHYLWGRRCRLRLVEREGRPGVRLVGKATLELGVRPGSEPAQRAAVLAAYYRAELKREIPLLLAHWAPVIGVEVAAWGVKRMKTRWGSCNIGARRIWLNLELAKKPPSCLEYVLVHELVHLLERRHNDRFRALMDHFLPQWQQHRATLNAAPLAHETWGY